MGGSSGGSSGTQRYADYIEDYHRTLLVRGDAIAFGIIDDGATYTHSPYATITVEDPDDAFFGSGNTISTYGSLYEILESYVTNTDVDALYETILNSMINSATIDNDVAAQGVYLSDDIDQVALPTINAGMRDINAVMATGFIHNKAFIESQRIKALNKYSATLKTEAMRNALQRWSDTLKWDMSTVELYMKLSQYYWLSRYDYIETKVEMAQKNYMWPLAVLDMQRSFIGALQGGSPSTQSSGASKGAKAAAGALGGAAAGAYIGAQVGAAGGPIAATGGAVIGGILGLAGGLL